MKSRVILVVLGLVLLGAGVTGIVAYHGEQAKQQKAYHEKIAAEQAKAAEEQEKAEQLAQQVEAEKQKTEDAKARLAAEQDRRKEEELLRRKLDEKQSEKNLNAVEQNVARTRPADRSKAGRATVERADRYARANSRQNAVSNSSKRTEVTSRANAGGSNAVTVHFRYDPGSGREIPVAQVHLGDKVQVRIRRVGGAADRLYVGLAAPRGGDSRYAGRGDRGPGLPTVVATPVRDVDEFTVTPAFDIAQELAGSLDSEGGAVLNIGTGRPRGSGSYVPARGYYDVEIRILADNSWNIRPRSLR